MQPYRRSLMEITRTLVTPCTHSRPHSHPPTDHKSDPQRPLHSAGLLLSWCSCVPVMGSCSAAEVSIVTWQRFLCILSQPTAPSVCLTSQSFFLLHLRSALHLRWPHILFTVLFAEQDWWMNQVKCFVMNTTCFVSLLPKCSVWKWSNFPVNCSSV